MVPEALQTSFIELGTDACLIGIGVSGALFATGEVSGKMGKGASSLAVATVFVNLIITGLCLRVKDSQRGDITKARLSIFLGLLILIVNTAIALEARQ